MQVDYNKINDVDEQNINLVSTTPILAGRDLKRGAPSTPMNLNWSRANPRTPLAMSNIRIAR